MVDTTQISHLQDLGSGQVATAATMGAAQGSAMDDALGTGPAEDEVDCQGKCPAFLQRAGMLKRSSLAKTTVCA